MTTDEERQRDDYLWDPSAEPSPDVQAVERLLAPVRFDAADRPLMLPDTAASRRRYGRPLLAMAATLAVAAMGAAAFWSWRSHWTAGAAWPLTIEGRASQGASASQLRPNQPLRLDPTASANIDIARIGKMRVAPGSALTVLETRSKRHRVLLDQGVVDVRVWAPPATFAFRTPAGNVIDLGCIFTLSVAADGTSRVQVDTGWVQMENGWGEQLIPAGASSSMTATTPPGVPVFEDAAPAFAAGVRAIERNADDALRNGVLDVVLRNARKRDVITLLMLARTSPAGRRPIIVRAAELVPPPSTVNLDAVAAGDREQLWLWYDSLDLPPVKSWWLNWRDALPRSR
jgi:ferric-dicitrate binding protein FerR (iron transport regulator)